MERLKVGDTQALAPLYQRYRGVVNAVLRRGGDHFDWDGEALAGGFVYSSTSRGQSLDFRPAAKQDYQFTVSGPTFLPKTTFLANLSRHATDDATYGVRRFTSARTPDGSPAAVSRRTVSCTSGPGM